MINHKIALIIILVVVLFSVGYQQVSIREEVISFFSPKIDSSSQYLSQYLDTGKACRSDLDCEQCELCSGPPIDDEIIPQPGEIVSQPSTSQRMGSITTNAIRRGFYGSQIGKTCKRIQNCNPPQPPFGSFTVEDGEPIIDEDDIIYFSAVPTCLTQEILVEEIFTESTELDIDYGGRISSISFSGSLELLSPSAYARIILTDYNDKEFSIFSSDSFIPCNDDEIRVNINNFCEETCNILTTDIKNLKVEIKDASLTIDKFHILDEDGNFPLSPIIFPEDYYKERHLNIKINILNERNQREGLDWIAGDSEPCGLEYYEKKQLLGVGKNEELPNLCGLECYKGGVFQRTTESGGEGRTRADSLPENWDWRDRHGEDWTTPVRNQLFCGSCWAFSAVGATEVLTNLYFNQHLNLDLSEQELVSCAADMDCGCDGWSPGLALDYITNHGVSDKDCFLYQAIDACGCNAWLCIFPPVNCDNLCTNPNERIRISGRNEFTDETEETLKTMIIEDGGVVGGILSWNHSMNLVGYERDTVTSDTLWVFKNSWGELWGESGYVTMTMNMSDFVGTRSLSNPIISEIQDYTILCNDKDGDGYCNWGVSNNKPTTCPASCNGNNEKDCDDSDPDKGPFDEYYNCVAIEDVVFQCSDDIDNDGDGVKDYPNDFSCVGIHDDDETNPKAECQDGLDNDWDGVKDYPNDDSCSSYQDNYEDSPDVDPQCADGVDNDGDGLTDLNDPGCENNQDDNEADGTSQCQDGVDNDGDGATDYPNDFSCTSSIDNDEANPKAQCQNGIDDDSDRATDYPEDFSCSSFQDTSETIPRSECQNNQDDDSDGKSDYPHDFSCSSYQDNSEDYPLAKCQDGIDNDNDGQIDWPADSGCVNGFQDNYEYDCGDDKVNHASEDCDGTDLAGETCITFGYNSGTLSCEDDCKFDLTECSYEPMPVCGNGNIEYGEDCEPPNEFGGITCTSLGFDGGNMLCTDNCRLDTSECTVECTGFGGWEYYPGFAKCVWVTYNANADYNTAFQACTDIDGYMPYSNELGGLCSAQGFRIRPGTDLTGSVRTRDLYLSGHKMWHDKGFHFTSDECGQVYYQTCGTTGTNANCQPVTSWSQDNTLRSGIICLKDLITVPRCGNNDVETGEECDDGNRDNYDGCSMNCEVD
ncbi:MAG: hypothetical protein KJ858_03750, partial [Nanoarchaeota archaeon]|nr:hypothetical protein [Nanoarchaeota archaeon]